jgi:predicted RND superfamily exporter protein
MYNVLDVLLPLAMSIFMVALVIFCKAYIEVFLLLVSIGVSILINMGTNIIFPSISDMTLSIAAVLQLALSIDYSIMLFHRYEQEKLRLAERPNNVLALKRAIKNAFSSISSSAVTTIVGLLVLLLMSFTIGADMGLVMAKGILCSLICVFTVMPTMLLWCDKLLLTTNKKYLREQRLLKKAAEENDEEDEEEYA